MRNKLIEYFFTIANMLFFIGIIASSILIINDAKKVELPQPNGFVINPLFYLPYIICLFLSIVLLVTFIILKNNYFKLIRMHVKHTWFYLHYLSCLLILLNFIFASLMFIFAPSLNAYQLKTFYFYILIAIVILISLISTGINSYSKIKIKIELAIRRTKGKEELNEPKKNEEQKGI